MTKSKATTKKKPGPKGPSKWTAERIREEAEALAEWCDTSIDNVWFKSFALERGYPPQYLSEWAARTDEDGNPLHPEFLEAYKKAETRQEQRLVQGGVMGLFNPTMCIFVLKNRHNWKDVRGVQHGLDEATTRTLDDVLKQVDGSTKGLPGGE